VVQVEAEEAKVVMNIDEVNIDSFSQEIDLINKQIVEESSESLKLEALISSVDR
jgi:hypothetical protein